MKLTLLVAAITLISPTVFALQTLQVRDGVTAQATISIKDTSRIKVEGQLITEVFGDVRANGSGRLVVATDENKGELYVKPAFGDAAPEPIHIFVVTAAGTYGLLLKPTDTPADTIALVDRNNIGVGGVPSIGASNRLADKGVEKPVSSYVRQLKNMMVAMASDTLSGMQVRDVNASVLLWNEADTTHVRDVIVGSCTGSQYHLREKLGKPMVLDEREFFVPSVAAVAIEQLNLPAYGSTHIYTIKCGVRQ